MNTLQRRAIGRIVTMAFAGLWIAAIGVVLSIFITGFPLQILIAGMVIGGAFGWLRSTLDEMETTRGGSANDANNAPRTVYLCPRVDAPVVGVPAADNAQYMRWSEEQQSLRSTLKSGPENKVDFRRFTRA